MPKSKDIDIDYDQIRELVKQLDFGKKMALIKEVAKEREYRKNFYGFTEGLLKKYNIPEMTDDELDTFLHDRSWFALIFEWTFG